MLLLTLLACRNKDLGIDTHPLWTEDTAAVDADEDGYPASEDCNDEDPLVHPDAEETCDGVDQDCDGLVDNEAVDALSWWVDEDADGYGAGDVLNDCEQPEGTANIDGDCDDVDPAFNPGAVEDDCADPNDYNCDGSVGYADEDGDGWAACEECNDARADIHPDAEEICNGLDDDCSGAVADEENDDDADGWVECEPDGWEGASIHGGEDCDDTLDTTWPGADETCNSVDDDCDSDVDEDAIDALTWYADDDDDGFGDAGSTTDACEVPSGYTDDDQDCDDHDDDVFPGADEYCNGEDDDCDGDTDEDDAVDAETWYADTDSDGFGDPASTTASCSQPTGYEDDDEDCDDTDSAVNPDADEYCNSVDDDCDGDTDEDDALDADTWYEDGDSDGYGDASSTTTACSQPSGYLVDATDCDDNDDDINPGADEYCNGEDDDCDGTTDEDDALDADTWYIDSDGDGYGDSATSTASCDQPSGYEDDSDDCDDADGDINPGATEVCDGDDNDCDGTTDNGFTDTDGDGDANCVDASVWSYDFSTGSISDWSIVNLGGTNNPTWAISGGYLYEASNNSHSLAIGPDLGEMETYTFSADVYIGGAATDYLGLVFDYQDSSNFWVARVDDPTGYYSRYSPTGQVQLYQCSSGTCSVVASDSTVDFTLAYNTVVEMSVSVDGPDITVAWDGTDVLTHTVSSSTIGANGIGFFTSDNDGGSYYGSPEVTNP